jgi:hypothetical protein
MLENSPRNEAVRQTPRTPQWPTIQKSEPNAMPIKSASRNTPEWAFALNFGSDTLCAVSVDLVQSMLCLVPWCSHQVGFPCRWRQLTGAPLPHRRCGGSCASLSGTRSSPPPASRSKAPIFTEQRSLLLGRAMIVLTDFGKLTWQLPGAQNDDKHRRRS